jgi:hypothetical protein
LQRAIERLVVAPLAKWMLANPDARGGELRCGWDAEAGVKFTRP